MKPMPNTAMPQVALPSHYAQLDGLRGSAILLVIVFHFCLLHDNFRSADSAVLLQLAQVGWMGVDLFFVLSGFLITGILVKTKADPHYFRNFLGRRFLRIWPLYYLSLLVLLVLLPAVMAKVPHELLGMQAKQAWFWLYGTNWLFAIEGGFGRTPGGYFWSLAVEEQFYLVWPFVVYALSDRRLLQVSVGLLCFSMVSRIVLAGMGVGSGALYNMTFTHLDGLAIGSCLAICLRSPALTSRLRRMVPVAVGLAVVALLAVRLADRDFFFWSRNMAVYGFTPIAVLCGALLMRVVSSERHGAQNPVLCNRFMRLCGKYSYALYMVHVPVSAVLFRLIFRVLEGLKATLGYDLTFLLAAIASFAVSWILAVASWHLLEKRILALKHHFEAPSPVVIARPAPQL